MTIEERDFRLIPVKDSGDRFDLELLRTINKGKETERQEFKNAAYGVTVESAIRHIANARIAANSPDVIDLKTYLEEYKKIIDEIKKLCGN